MKLMKHLTGKRGFREIAFISDRVSHPSYMMRYLGYLDALEQRGLTPYSAPELPHYDLLGRIQDYNRILLEPFGLDEIPRIGTPIILPGLSMQLAYEEASKLMLCEKFSEAIFCATDNIAFGVLQASRERGMRVPEDIAVCGYADIEAAATCNPPLTTVLVDRDALAGKR